MEDLRERYRPDIIIVKKTDGKRILTFVELTCPYEDNLGLEKAHDSCVAFHVVCTCACTLHLRLPSQSPSTSHILTYRSGYSARFAPQ